MVWEVAKKVNAPLRFAPRDDPHTGIPDYSGCPRNAMERDRECPRWTSVVAPIIGIGGVMEASDVLEFMTVGASAVAVGTANIISPDNALKIIEELPKLLKEENIQSISRLIGTFKV
jgi:2,4-dienoyl-CoA reductase-like NADH-dependent reductase (Old Yellow Enzyme family)